MLAAPTHDHDRDPGTLSERPLELVAPDGVPLAADVYEPPEPRAAVLLAPAMGVKRGFYARYARWLAQQGLAVLALDYRGIGGSRRGSLRRMRASLLDWAELDLVAGAEALTRRHPGLPLRFFGHSVGGQLMGFVPDAPFERAVMVASQSGQWRHWDGAARAGMMLVWHVGIPVLTSAIGYLPGRALGGGEDIPRGVARQWARWGRHPEYLGVSARAKGGAWFAGFRGALRSYAITDDLYAPERSVRALFDVYGGSERELRVLAPRDHGLERIGHFGLFRIPALWPEVSELLVR